MIERGTPGLVVAAPSSGCGKTLITLGLIAALRRRGFRVGAAKAGPDYIDAAFLSRAAGAPAVNLDSWAMRPGTLGRLVAEIGAGRDGILVEGVMGLFDGGDGGAGSTADLAARLGMPVMLVVDARAQAQSAAALARGFADFDPRLSFAGVILNRVSGGRHERLIRDALQPTGLKLFGAVPRMAEIELPSRHLGLVQAAETIDLEEIIEAAGRLAAGHIDLDAIAAAFAPARFEQERAALPAPPGQRIAFARDRAFGFAYEHLFSAWKVQGADISFFSPLADEAPDRDADVVWLPGGYPELHAARLAASHRFLDGLRGAAARGTRLFGECGGYMVLGQGLIDETGARHAMAGLLQLETSFARRRLCLGYRRATVIGDTALAPSGTGFRCHEFHYATTERETGEPLFRVAGPDGTDLGTAGLRNGLVAGSFLHVIDSE